MNQPRWWEVLIFSGLIMAAIFILSITAGCATPPKPVTTSPDEKVVTAPIAAINLSKCDGSVALYVIIDPTHVVRFDQNQTTIFTLDHGQVTETAGPPTPYANALDLAQSAGITSHANVPCDGLGI